MFDLKVEINNLYYKLFYFKVPIQIGSTYDVITSALNDLPTLYPYQVVVVPADGGFNVTFPADFGNIRLIIVLWITKSIDIFYQSITFLDY